MVACLIYLAATVVLTYPLSTSPASLSRLDNGDARLNAWAISWVAHQLVHDPFRLFEANTFYPLPHSLAYSEHLTLHGLLALPILGITNDLVLTNNLLLLLSVFLSAFTMYLLTVRLTGSHLAALLAGLFFSFAPFRFNRLPHIQMQLYAFIPLILLGLHRFIETRKTVWLVLLGGAFVLQALSGTYLAAIASVALGVAMVALLPIRDLTGKDWLRLGACLMGIGLILIPFTLPYLWVHRELGIEWDLSGLGSLSATPRSYLASSTHLYHRLSETLTRPEDRADYLFPGLVLLVLGCTGMGLLAARRGQRAVLFCYAGILVAGVILSLGPATPIHPFLYEHVLFFRGLRALTRFGLLPFLSLSVMSAYTLAWLFEGSGRIRRRRWAALAITVFFVAESTALPYRLEPFEDTPPEVYTWLANAKPGSIVELPFKVIDTRYMFWSRHHGFRPMLNGDSGFVPMSHQWAKIALNRFPSPDAIELLRRLKVRYVVLHLGAFRKPALLRLLQGIEQSRNALLPTRDFGRDVVFEVLPGTGDRDVPDISDIPDIPDRGSPPPLAPLPASGDVAELFDGDVQEPWQAASSSIELRVELLSEAAVSGLRFHYGFVPRVPVRSVELLVEPDASGAETSAATEPRRHRRTPEDWPAVAELVSGLLETPKDGTQTIDFNPVVGRRFTLRLVGLDDEPPAITEVEILGAVDAEASTGTE